VFQELGDASARLAAVDGGHGDGLRTLAWAAARAAEANTTVPADILRPLDVALAWLTAPALCGPVVVSVLLNEQVWFPTKAEEREAQLRVAAGPLAEALGAEVQVFWASAAHVPVGATVLFDERGLSRRKQQTEAFFTAGREVEAGVVSFEDAVASLAVALPDGLLLMQSMADAFELAVPIDGVEAVSLGRLATAVAAALNERSPR
jgi:hypothetical protein